MTQRQINMPSKNDLLRRLKDDGYTFGSVIDVGVMTSTPELLQHYGDLPQLLCEPVKEFHDKIRENYGRAGVKFDLEPRAVSSKTETAELEIVTKAGGASITHAGLQKHGSDADASRQISTVTLDDSIAEHGMVSPFLLKVDVDGFEVNVLRCAHATLENTLVLIIEATIERFSEINTYMSSCGFEIYDVVDICYNDGAFWQCDLVFINPDVAKQTGVERSKSVENLATYQPFQPERYVNIQSAGGLTPAFSTPNMTELENYRLLVPHAIQTLARSGPIDQWNWKEIARKRPADVAVWNAVRRANRRVTKGQQLGFFDEPPFAQQDVRVCQLIKRLSIPIHTIIDVGAAHRDWTEHTKTVFPNAEYHLFESLAQHVDLYRRAHAKRKAAEEDYTLHEMALSDADGETTIDVHDNIYAPSLMPHSSGHAFSKVKVPLAKLDTLLLNGKIPQADIIKMDTQGSELKILLGATQMLKDTKFIVAETWFQRDNGPETPLVSELVAFLADHSFQPFDYGDPWRQDSDGRLGSLDIWFANTSITELGAQN